MDWILTGIFQAILTAMQQCFTTLSADFVSHFGINIGSTFTTLSRSYTVYEVLANFEYNSGNSLFDTVFPGARMFEYAMGATGFCFVIVIGTLEIYKSFFGPISQSEHPGSILGRMTIAGIGVISSYDILLVVEYFFNELYVRFLKVGLNAQVAGTGSKTVASFAESSKDVSLAIKTATDSMFSPEGINKWGYAAASTQDASKVATGGSLFLSLFCVIALGAVLVQFFKLLLEIVERYVVLGVLFYTCPLPIAALSSKNTSGVFKAWSNMVFSQFLLLIMNSFFLNTFLGAMIVLSKLKNLKELGITSYLVYLLCLIAWLIAGQKADQYLKSLGLSTAQAGGNLWGAAMSSIVAGRAAIGGAKKAVKAGKSAGHAVSAGSKKVAAAYNSKTSPFGTQTTDKGQSLSNFAAASGKPISANSLNAAKSNISSAKTTKNGVGLKTNNGGNISLTKEGQVAPSGFKSVPLGNGNQINYDKKGEAVAASLLTADSRSQSANTMINSMAKANPSVTGLNSSVYEGGRYINNGEGTAIAQVVDSNINPCDPFYHAASVTNKDGSTSYFVPTRELDAASLKNLAIKSEGTGWYAADGNNGESMLLQFTPGEKDISNVMFSAESIDPESLANMSPALRSELDQCSSSITTDQYGMQHKVVTAPIELFNKLDGSGGGDSCFGQAQYNYQNNGYCKYYNDIPDASPVSDNAFASYKG